MAFLVEDETSDIGVDEADAAYADRMAADSELTLAEKLLIPQLVDVIWAFASGPNSFTGITMHPYQEEFGRRFIESVVSNDGAELTACFARQSGKSETVADVVSALMILLPILASLPQFSRILAKFARGVLIGTFAPVGEQAATLFDRIRDRLTSDRAKIFLADPEIDDEVESRSGVIQLKRSRSLVRVQTAHPKAQIESKTYHIIIIDEAQGADEKVVNKSIGPMGANTNATRVMLGTPSYIKGIFYRQIKINQRAELQRGAKKSHFQVDWKRVAKCNPDYAKYVKKEMQTKGADSDEFRLAYRVEWILERGMFITSSALDALGDPKMRRVKTWAPPVLVGIDPARKIDSTVVTVVSVDWDHPNENGFFHHLVLDWLDMTGEKWEEQYYLIAEFLKGYPNIAGIGIDEGGMGDIFADRMRHILPHVQVNGISSSPQAQSKRWKYLTTLMTGSHPRYGKLLRYPAHSSAKRTKTWKKFYEQMTSLEKKYQGPYMLAEAPDEAQAHDDFPDSLALACIQSEEFAIPEIEVTESILSTRWR